MRFKTLVFAAAALVISGITTTSADHHEPPPPPPTKEEMFTQMDANGDGVVTWEEFQAWYNAHMMGPMHGDGGPMDGGGGPMDGGGGPMDGGGAPMEGEMPVPPMCSEELRMAENQPQQTNVMASNGLQGNLLFRTVCGDMPGFDQVAISLPSGRQALDFDVEAITPGNVTFGIRVEGGADVYHSSAGKAALHSLLIEDVTPSSTGIYTIYIDPSMSDPGSRVTIRFIDTPK